MASIPKVPPSRATHRNPAGEKAGSETMTWTPSTTLSRRPEASGFGPGEVRDGVEAPLLRAFGGAISGERLLDLAHGDLGFPVGIGEGRTGGRLQ